jgi:predicted PurR-regulated permease PerM
MKSATDPRSRPAGKTISIPVPDAATARRAALKAAVVIAVCILVYLVRAILLPIALAFLLAMVLDPIVDRMERRGWSRARASAFIFGSFIVIVVGLCILSYPFIVSQFQSVQQGFDKYFPDTSRDGLIKSFQHLGLSKGLANDSVAALASAQVELRHSSISISTVGMSFASNLVWIVIVPIIAFYALRDFHVILAKGLLLVPSKWRNVVQVAVTEITAVFGKYLRGLAIVSVLNGVATAILLSALGVHGALLLGILAGLLYTVPYVGAVLTILITAAVVFVGGGLHLALIAVGLSVLLHQIIFDQIITPRILGGQVGLHPILSIIALLVGNLLLGIVGMILAVPVAACIQIAVLAMQPKLSKEIEIASIAGGPTDSVQSVEKETKDIEEQIDAAHETRLAVTTAVESIEKEIAAEARASSRTAKKR